MLHSEAKGLTHILRTQTVPYLQSCGKGGNFILQRDGVSAVVLETLRTRECKKQRHHGVGGDKKRGTTRRIWREHRGQRTEEGCGVESLDTGTSCHCRCETERSTARKNMKNGNKVLSIRVSQYYTGRKQESSRKYTIMVAIDARAGHRTLHV